jgi:hypothetical protein
MCNVLINRLDSYGGLVYGGNGFIRDAVRRGTAVLQAWGAEAEAAPLAMVVRTSFRSAKGQLVRSMLHPEELAVRESFAHIRVK